MTNERKLRNDTLEEAAALCDQRAKADDATSIAREKSGEKAAAHEWGLCRNTWVIAAHAIRSLKV